MRKPVQRNITDLLHAYHTYLLSKVGKVRILGEADERELKEVFVGLSITRQRATWQQAGLFGVLDSAMRRRSDPIAGAERDAAPKPSRQTREESIRRVMPDELLRRGTKAIVAGAPGCGKTTLLKYLALKAQEEEGHLVVWLELKAIDKPLFAQAERASARAGRLILQEIWLRHLTVQLSLSNAEIKLLRRHWEEKYWANEIIVLLDGFDELQDETIERGVNKCIGEFVLAPHDNSLLISTRPYAQHALGNGQLQELEVGPLNHDQIAAFLNYYFPNDATGTKLLKSLRERPSLRELLNVPLLLGIVLRLYREDRFTSERLKLYEAVVNELIYELDRSKFVRRSLKVADESLHLDFLKFLAFERLFTDSLGEAPGTNPFVFGKDLLKEKARQFLARENLSPGQTYDLVTDVIQTPLLREVSRNSYAFTHTTLHEYLAACHFAGLYQKKGHEFEGANILCRALHNPTLVELEVLPMMLGGLKNADGIYESLEQLPESFTFANLRLRARGLGYGAAIGPEQLTAVVERFVQVILETKVESKPYFETVCGSFAAAPHVYLDAIAERLEQLLPNCIDYLRMKITDALGHTGGDKSASILRLLLQDKLGFVRQKAAYWLGQLGDERTVSALASALNDADAQVVSNAAHALVKIGTEEAVAAIIDAVQSDDVKARSAAIFWLGILGGEKVLDLIEEILAGDERDVRLKAVESLGFIGGERALSILYDLYQGDDFGIRTTSVTAAGQCGGEKAIELLLEALRDPTGEVRTCAIDALSKIDGKRFVDVFIAGLRDPHPYVRRHAAMALNAAADRKAIPALLAALDYQSQADIVASHRGLVVSAAALALQHFNDEGVVQALTKLLLEDRGNEGAANAAIALGRIGDKRAVGPLLNVLRRSFNYLRAHVADGLGLIGDKRATLPLVEALQAEDDIVRMRAVEALGRIKDERSVEALLAALQYADPVREEAALALRFFEGGVFAEELIKATAHQNPFVRRKAVSYVGYYSSDPTLLERISHMAETDEDDFVRRTALEALTRFSRKLESLNSIIDDSTKTVNDNESKEGLSLGEVQAIVSKAGHIYRRIPPPDWGIDVEIEFKNDNGEASGLRVYLQLKSGDSYLYRRESDGKEIFRIKNSRHPEYWQTQAYPVLLVIRNSSGQIRWMNITEYLRLHGKDIRSVVFQGEAFTAESVKKMRARFFNT